ncbi:DUF5666 domain-containing protein [Thiomicrorhabdus xiamenensis]|uniref:DUF5666 domain-containing protein n=1 Tax=Thiomicrorhabdus xiamenensis TaxID=2739063 RepID=A0A7D4TF79_9GAMM|nr:DUF5666 domain-containing protein [Thiomicrorhabdus xiamenensis]QKI89927.1 hypothetical protein HQN79_10250 [Thiomicrorhabdus xiamenensis]
MTSLIKRHRLKLTTLSGALALALTGCGGGGTAGIGGTGYISTGTITGFGSVMVGGVKYETDNAVFEVDGNTVDATQDDLKVGMVVRVEGTINDDGISGTATKIIFDDDLQGPIANLAVDPNDPDITTFTIYGTTVIVKRTRTEFDDALTYATLANDIPVEVSGYYNADGALVATYIDDKNDAESDSNEFKIKGEITALDTDNGTFVINGQQIQYTDQTDLDDDISALANGLTVEVEGLIDGTSGALIASEIEFESPDDYLQGASDDDEFELEGYIENFDGTNSTFTLHGITVDFTGVEIESDFISLADNVWVNVEGFLQDGALIATEIDLRDSEIDLDGTVKSTDLDANGVGSFVLTVAGSDLTIYTGYATSFDDSDDHIDNRQLTVGEFIEVDAYRTADGELFALEIERDDEGSSSDDGSYEFQGIYEGTVDSEITVSGVTFTIDTSGTNTLFENDELSGPQSLSELLSYDTTTQPKLLLDLDYDSNGFVSKIDVEDTEDN